MTSLHDKLLSLSVFSLHFSSAVTCKGLFMASKVKNMHQKCNLLGGEGGEGSVE